MCLCVRVYLGVRVFLSLIISLKCRFCSSIRVYLILWCDCISDVVHYFATHMQQLKQDYEADPSFALSPDFSELDPKLQMQMDELVQDSVPPDMIAFVFALLDHVRLESHRIFLNTCSVWLNR
jgi:hypothetical protein